MNSAYKEIGKDIINNYDFDTAIERFFVLDDEYGDHMISLMLNRKDVELNGRNFYMVCRKHIK